MLTKIITSLVFFIGITLFIFPNVFGVGTFTVDIYEIKRQVIFSENQYEQTIYMEGVVNYSGISLSEDTIELSSLFDLGESSISPKNITFQTSGSEEFIVELTIINEYENGTIGNLYVNGEFHGEGIYTGYTDNAVITIINSTGEEDNDNLTNQGDDNAEKKLFENNNLIFVISIIIIIGISIIYVYKKRL